MASDWNKITVERNSAPLPSERDSVTVRALFDNAAENYEKQSQSPLRHAHFGRPLLERHHQ